MLGKDASDSLDTCLEMCTKLANNWELPYKLETNPVVAHFLEASKFWISAGSGGNQLFGADAVKSRWLTLQKMKGGDDAKGYQDAVKAIAPFAQLLPEKKDLTSFRQMVSNMGKKAVVHGKSKVDKKCTKQDVELSLFD